MSLFTSVHVWNTMARVTKTMLSLSVDYVAKCNRAKVKFSCRKRQLKWSKWGYTEEVFFFCKKRFRTGTDSKEKLSGRHITEILLKPGIKPNQQTIIRQ